MSQQNLNENNPNICPICFQDVIESRRCLGCKNQFCKLCVLQWKQTKDICPLKCNPNKWLIDLDDINEKNSDGFIVCPFDKNIGNMNCRSCKKPLNFSKIEHQAKYKCKNCQSTLEYFLSNYTGHEDCKQLYSYIYYYYCRNCDLKICSCIEKENDFQ
ncbi:hypothetical protein TTHERM_000931899 (macronuclear) [Tetrahymena thermophila SB210]|uniref:RING-type domain-containing protein n=1 Tax=Tetrahymena thermophila (strain SB210) TaxID=312017 RepID=W7X637_TETTS|nr:hypothetical protein TTHERM_000931899 [Tetrahymena thermophila SB210]EWS72862.1 hypothetical protein TTHERM_000931899 [Tetrahymena thermophila SB210]|eukprot:XP_012654590.1 hypothetical protein TTHERM_000931899 [Tetrahymena thermophila SB210]